MKRTATCGELRKSDAGRCVVLNGWVHRTRKLGALTFILLRDRYGITQAVVSSEAADEVKQTAGALKPEFCVAARGTVRLRGERDVNAAMATGEVEVLVECLEVLTPSKPLPFAIDEVRQKDGTVVLPGEELRLRYRYLDLRRPPMQRNIILRSAVTFAVREYLTQQGFLEIETPTFIKSTPEGARDYLVPSRLHPGKFYSLPQSPQLYKQLLMVAGFDKYFQIARCYRDEDARGDRQPEFTQIDMEMSFVDREDVLAVTEGMMAHVFKATLGVDLATPFKRLSWEEAVDLYGSDKPDLRFDLAMQDASFMAALSDFGAFKAGAAATGREVPRHKRSAVKALVVKGAAHFSRKKIEELENVAKTYKAKGLAWFKVSADGTMEGGIAKFFAQHEREVLSRLGAVAGDLVLIVADESWQKASCALGAVRRQLGAELGLTDAGAFCFVWIVDFPYFAWNEDEGKWETEHHMFTMPQRRYWATLEADPASVKGDLYDLVLNGCEIASGSMRINDPELQRRIFRVVGYSEERAQKAFGFLVNALGFGAPPHGGIAPGLDRLVMLMCRESSIHEVIAFPKNTLASSPMDECPSEVDARQLEELHIKVVDSPKTGAGSES